MFTSNQGDNACKSLSQLVEGVSVDSDNFVSKYGIEPDNVLYDEVQDMSFSGQELTRYMQAQYGASTVPLVFFNGMFVGGTMETISLMASKPYWDTLANEHGVLEPQ